MYKHKLGVDVSDIVIIVAGVALTVRLVESIAMHNSVIVIYVLLSTHRLALILEASD